MHGCCSHPPATDMGSSLSPAQPSPQAPGSSVTLVVLPASIRVGMGIGPEVPRSAGKSSAAHNKRPTAPNTDAQPFAGKQPVFLGGGVHMASVTFLSPPFGST